MRLAITTIFKESFISLTMVGYFLLPGISADIKNESYLRLK